MGDPTSSYATAGIALSISGVLKPHHHDKVETPLAGSSNIIMIITSRVRAIQTGHATQVEEMKTQIQRNA
jgi:hypothetical protein